MLRSASSPKLPTLSWLEDLALHPPALILGIRDLDYRDPELYDFAPGLVWHRLQHQTAGMACHQWRGWATILPLRDAWAGFATQLNEKFLDSNIACMGLDLEAVIEYREFIRAHGPAGIDCRHAWPQLEEACYVFDDNVDVLRELTLTSLPDDLDDLVIWHDELDKVFGSLNRWSICILGENCD